MIRLTLLARATLLLAALFPTLALAATAPPKPSTPFLEQYCYNCHDTGTKKGSLDLESLSRDLADPETMSVWVRVHDRLAKGDMPPKGKTQPPDPQRGAYLTALASSLTAWDAASKGTRVRRLNRTEYEDTLCDLFDIRSQLAELLPEDGKAFGFDTVSEALDLSPVHLQRYLTAATVALQDALQKGPAPVKQTVTATFEHGIHGTGGLDRIKQPDGSITLFGNGQDPLPIITPEFFASADGLYRFKISGHAFQTADPVTFTLVAGDGGKRAELRPIGTFNLPAAPTTLTPEIYLRAGEHLRVQPRFFVTKQDFRKISISTYQGPGLVLQPIEIEGPLLGEWPGRGRRLLFADLKDTQASKNSVSAAKLQAHPGRAKALAGASAQHYRIVSDNPEADAERLLQQFVPAAFRRPVTAEKIAPYLKLARDEMAAGAVFEDAMLTAYTAVLCSPDFLYLLESPGRLDNYAVASRLSYLLWSSAPDTELLAAAAKGDLSSPAGLRAQTDRMLAAPRSARFVEDFTKQWLSLEEIDATTPDQQLYPEFDDTLKEAMVQETQRFFAEVLRGNQSILNFLDSNWTMANEPLASFYGLPGVKGLEFRKVPLPASSHRGGLLTQASILKVTANGSVTSPVLRGAWVLSHLLNAPSPPPPPGTPGIEPDTRGAKTLRQQLDAHRSLATCNGCHRIIDPPGFALENFDVMGGWRENYRKVDNSNVSVRATGKITGGTWAPGLPVDASGVTPEGRFFHSLADYKKVLLSDPRRFTRALTEKVAIYASGRGMGFSDRAELDRLAAAVAAKGYGFRDLLDEVIQSDIFRQK